VLLNNNIEISVKRSFKHKKSPITQALLFFILLKPHERINFVELKVRAVAGLRNNSKLYLKVSPRGDYRGESSTAKLKITNSKPSMLCL
jgi:hypothetical protein